MPLSYAMICCVRTAISADASVGIWNASSNAHVKIDCAPPNTAAIVSTVTRAMLLYGCGATSDEPPHTTPKRKCCAFGSVTP